jgi:hypothetical protein
VGFVGIELEHEVAREAIEIALHCLVQFLGLNAVELRQIRVE